VSVKEVDDSHGRHMCSIVDTDLSLAVLGGVLLGLGVEGTLIRFEFGASGFVDHGSGILLVEEATDVFNTGGETSGRDPRLKSSGADGTVTLLDSTVPHLGLEGDVRDSVGESTSQVVLNIELLALVRGTSGPSESEDELAFLTSNVLFPSDAFIRGGGSLLQELIDLSLGGFGERHLTCICFIK